jgi:hypothetical protein
MVVSFKTIKESTFAHPGARNKGSLYNHLHKTDFNGHDQDLANSPRDYKQETNPIVVQNHSALRLVTGFAMAALTAWKLTVIQAITRADPPAIKNTDQPTFIR